MEAWILDEVVGSRLTSRLTVAILSCVRWRSEKPREPIEALIMRSTSIRIGGFRMRIDRWIFGRLNGAAGIERFVHAAGYTV